MSAPFDAVLTHGFIVDGNGRKMSKSLGNVVSPLDIIAKSGADIVRLWVASADYGQDVSVSDEIIDRTSEAYRRIRNTFRFLLSNLYDFDPATDSVPLAEMPELDRYAMTQLANVLSDVTTAYDEWRFHAVFRTIYDYVGDLSGVYLDVLKDRLYADAPASASRRSAQTVLSAILGVLVRVLAPILSFTAEEVWQYMPESLRDAKSVHLSDWPTLELRRGYGRAGGGLHDGALGARGRHQGAGGGAKRQGDRKEPGGGGQRDGTGRRGRRARRTRRGRARRAVHRGVGRNPHG